MCSKPALTEGLEIDQYIWAILNTLSSTPIEEVTIDSDANWKSVHGLSAANIKVKNSCCSVAYKLCVN